MDSDVYQPALSLKERLRHIRDEARSYQVGDRVDGKLIPSSLRHEIVSLYDEHGGDEIILSLTKLGYNTLRQWHQQFRRDPTYYLKKRREKKNHDLSRKKIVSTVLGTPDVQDTFGDKELLPSTIKKADTKSEASVEEIRSSLPCDLVTRLEGLKRQMETTGDRSSESFKSEVAKLVLRAGAPRPVAVLLGLAEKTVATWRDAFIESCG